MKKRIIKIALMSISMLALASCKQEELVQAATQAVDNNRVIFASIEEYESLFADPNTTDEKVNAVAARYGTFTENARISGFEQAEDTLYPEVLQKILNNDHVVQIGDWLIKVDAAKEKIFVLDKQDEAEYQDLLGENLANEHLRVFSTDEDLFEVINEPKTSSNARIQDVDAGADKEIKDYYTYGPIGNNHGVRWYLRYRTYGILFQLQYSAEFWLRQTSGGISVFTLDQLPIAWDAIYTPRSKDQVTRSEVNSCYGCSYASKNIYSASRRLDKYSLKTRAEIPKKVTGLPAGVVINPFITETLYIHKGY